MSVLKIGVDLDGVLADFSAGWDALALYHPTPAERWSYINRTPAWWNLLAPYADARDVLRRLASLEDVETYFITSRPGSPAVRRYSEQWLERHGYYRHPAVVRVSHEEDDSKGHIARGLGLDLFIDDMPHNIEAVREHAPKCFAFLRAHAFNSTFHSDGVMRVDTVPEFADRVESFLLSMQEDAKGG